jgi:oligosaccharide repeat unit polymerase
MLLEKRHILLLLLYFIIALALFNLGEQYPIYIFLCILNSWICINNMTSFENEGYSLHKLVNLFILVFFICANAMQYISGANVTSIWTLFFTDLEFIFFQFIVFVILILYNRMYVWFRRKIKLPTNYTGRKKINVRRLFLISIVSLLLTLLMFINNPISLLVRGVSDDMDVQRSAGSIVTSSGPIALIFSKFIRPLSVCCYIIAKLANCTKQETKLLFMIALLSVIPTSLSRNAVAMYWLPIILLNFNILQKRMTFVLLMLIGIFVLFPVFDGFRHFNGDINFSVISFDYLVSMNFDASQMFMGVLRQSYITNGLQLLGVLLFFVPRSIWYNKPVGSGWTFAADNGATFTNVSMPYFAEGYINFGYIGLALFTIFCSYFTANMDKKYWSRQSVFFSGYYYLMLGIMIFIMRGDLMSSFAFTVGGLLSYHFVKKMVVLE